MTTTKPQPHAHVRLGSIRAAIWRNVDSEGRARFNTTYERIYRDEKGDWKSTSSFGRDDNMLLAKVADQTHTLIFQLQAQERDEPEPVSEPEQEAASVATDATKATAKGRQR
jgi:hypothetical protein